MDEFVRTPEVVKHPGFSILARSDILIQEAMNRQGLTLESLAAIAGPQISSRQSFVGSLASTLSSVGGVRNFNGSLILLSLNLCILLNVYINIYQFVSKLIIGSIFCQHGAWSRWFIGLSCAGRPNFNIRSKGVRQGRSHRSGFSIY